VAAQSAGDAGIKRIVTTKEGYVVFVDSYRAQLQGCSHALVQCTFSGCMSCPTGLAGHTITHPTYLRASW
jgi:hypothetical protein